MRRQVHSAAKYVVGVQGVLEMYVMVKGGVIFGREGDWVMLWVYGLVRVVVVLLSVYGVVDSGVWELLY